jgi:hypothetical protein
VGFVLAAYVFPAGAMWAVIGMLLAALHVATAALVVAAVYGAGYGAIELTGLAWPRPPGRGWQVPQEVLIGASPRRRVLVWGAILGPGFLTRNPYAGFGMLVALVACAGSLSAGAWLAAAVGVAHGCGRGAALLRDARTRLTEPFALVLRSMRWRMLDGVALLAVAGAAIMTAAFRPW